MSGAPKTNVSAVRMHNKSTSYCKLRVEYKFGEKLKQDSGWVTLAPRADVEILEEVRFVTGDDVKEATEWKIQGIQFKEASKKTDGVLQFNGHSLRMNAVLLVDGGEWCKHELNENDDGQMMYISVDAQNVRLLSAKGVRVEKFAPV